MSQSIKETSLPFFNQIEVYHCFCEIYLIPASKNYLVVESESLQSDKVIPSVLDDKLTFRFQPAIRRAEKFKLSIFYINLKSIKLQGEMQLITSDTITGKKLSLDFENLVRAQILIKVQDLKVKIGRNSQINISGKASDQTIVAKGRSFYRAFDLLSDNVSLDIEQQIIMEVNVGKNITGMSKFGSKVYYKGNPNQVDVTSKYGSSLIKKDK